MRSLASVRGARHKGDGTARGPAATSAREHEAPAERRVPLGEPRGFLRDPCPGLHSHCVFEAALASPARDPSQCLRAACRASAPPEAEASH